MKIACHRASSKLHVRTLPRPYGIEYLPVALLSLLVDEVCEVCHHAKVWLTSQSAVHYPGCARRIAVRSYQPTIPLMRNSHSNRLIASRQTRKSVRSAGWAGLGAIPRSAQIRMTRA